MAIFILLKCFGHRCGIPHHWYAGAPEMDHSQMMAQMHQKPGMSSHANMDMQGDIAKLQTETGKAFDRLFLDMMISANVGSRKLLI